MLSAGDQLERIENLFLEVQDVPTPELMYKSSHTLGQLTGALRGRGFVRQYALRLPHLCHTLATHY